METLNDGDCNYSTLKEDPEFLLTLLNKYVKVDMVKDVILSGYLLTIDPEQYSVVLIAPHGDSYRRVLIPGHAILNINESSPAPDTRPQITSTAINTLEDVAERKLRIISWFNKNLLPVSEAGDNIVLGNAFILPPYSPSDVCTDNPIVANQVRGIIMKMPDDYSAT